MNPLTIFAEPDGKLSLGRCCTALIVVCLLAYAGVIAVKAGTIPDVPENWLWLALAPFGISKAGATISVFGGGKGGPQQPAQ
ncbi:hypothetical protein [Geobacter sp.]|uniref:hypothetical protein n=1 Tax=Geobacter sp. TaxID=46610 RepID=UPI00261968FF|nr:hypothetical protein [Geobacter sp.]